MNREMGYEKRHGNRAHLPVKKGGFVATLPPNYVVLCCAVLCECLLLVAALLLVFDDGPCLLIPCSDVVADSIPGAEHEVVGASHEDFFAVEHLAPELLAVAFDLFAFGSFGFGDLGFGGQFDGSRFGDDDNGNRSRRHFILAQFRGCGSGCGLCGGSGGGRFGRGGSCGGCGLLCGSDEFLNQVIFGFRRSLLGFGGTAALFGSGICVSGSGSLGHFLALLLLLLLLRLVLIIVSLGFAATASVAGCDLGGGASARR